MSTAPQSGLKILHLYADSPSEWNVSQWRSLTPSDCLNAEHAAGRTPHTAKLFYLPTALEWSNPQVQRELGMYDVFIFQRNVLNREVTDAMDYWRRLGKAVAVDLILDDHYLSLPPSNPAFEYWDRNRAGMSPAPVPALIEAMQHADGLTSPSKIILADWAHLIPGYYVPNYTRWLWYENLMQKPAGAADIVFTYEQGSDPASPTGPQVANLIGRKREGSDGWLILGWGGSISHVDSWVYSGILPALERLFEKWPQARLKFCGHESRLNEYFAPFKDCIIRQDGVKPEHWPAVVSTFDVGLAPLDLRPLAPWREGGPVASYDERRSWLKGIEYLTAGVPWVGSDSATYRDLARWGRLVPSTPDAWFTALDSILTNLTYAKSLAWERRRWARKPLTMEANVNLYGDTFGRLLAEKQTRAGAHLPGIVYSNVTTEKAAVTA